MSQINLRLPETLRKKAEKHVKERGYRNIQELTMEALREKVNEEFTRKELIAIEKRAQAVLKEKSFPADDAFKELRSRR